MCFLGSGLTSFAQNNYIESHLFFFKVQHLFKNLFIYFRLHWVSAAAHRLSLVAVSQGLFFTEVCGLLFFGAFSCAKHGLYGAQASVVAAHRLNSCGTQALVAPRCM